MLLASDSLGVDSLGIVTADATPVGPGVEVSATWTAGVAGRDTIYLLEIDAVARPGATIPALRRIDDASLRGIDDGRFRLVEMPADLLLETPRTFRFASAAWASKPTDTPANTPYAARLEQPLTIERQIPLSPLGSRRVATTLGRCVLINADGGLDELLSGYTCDGRGLRLYVVERGDALADAELVFSGMAVGAFHNQGSVVEIGVADSSIVLDKPMQGTLFAGTGGVEGGDDAKAKPKPIAMGYIRNINPPLTSYPDQLFMFGDAEIRDVLEVRDNGVPLTSAGAVADVLTWTPVAGHYVYSRSQAAIRLGSTAFGQITADVEGDRDGGLYLDSPALLALRILRDRAGIADADIDIDAFVELHNSRPWRAGLWTGLNIFSFAAAIDALMRSLNAWWGPGVDGRITTGLATAPEGTVGGTLDASILLGLAQISLPDDVLPAVSRFRAAWDPNYTVQLSGTDGAEAELKAYIEKPHRIAVAPEAAADPDIAAAFLLAREPDPVETLLRAAPDAEALVAEWFDLFGGAGRMFTGEISDDRVRIGLGDQVRLVFPRFGLDYGRKARVLGHRLDAAARRVTYRLWVP